MTVAADGGRPWNLGSKLRRFSTATARAFGVAEDTDFDRLHDIQRQRADKRIVSTEVILY